MPRCRVVKGGWYWLGVKREVGEILDAPSEQWIANRIADGGLVEPVAEPVVEKATRAAPEKAVARRGKNK